MVVENGQSKYTAGRRGVLTCGVAITSETSVFYAKLNRRAPVGGGAPVAGQSRVVGTDEVPTYYYLVVSASCGVVPAALTQAPPASFSVDLSWIYYFRTRNS